MRFGGISANEGSLYLGVDDGGSLREVRRQIRLGVPKAAEALKAEGIEHVLVNGTEIATGGVLTGDRPGTLLRSGRDTETVEVANVRAG